jgi:hypothetical protein
MDLDLRVAPLDGPHILYPLFGGYLSGCTTRACSRAAASIGLGIHNTSPCLATKSREAMHHTTDYVWSRQEMKQRKTG